MIQIIYYITKENELIFARNFQFETLLDAENSLKDTYNDIKLKDNIKDINYEEKQKLIFIDTAKGESDEIHTFLISKGEEE